MARNRLIAALGLGTVVVEAALRSGSLVTAHQAAELGRAVFAVPGPVTSSQSTGTNRLLSDGAVPALEAAQILAELGLASGRRHHRSTGRSVGDAPVGRASPANPVSPVGSVSPAGSASPASLSGELPSGRPALGQPARDESAQGVLARDDLPSDLGCSTDEAGSSPPVRSLSLEDAATDPVIVLVREALPTVRSGRAAEVLELAVATGLEPARVLASLGRLAARGRAVKTGKGWALG